MSSLSLSARTWISTVFRFVLAGVWLYAGVIKLTQPGGARDAVIAYRVFPASSVDFLGWLLPAIEVGLGALLLLGLFTRAASIASALLFTTFIILISSVWIRGYSIDCGCFGGGGDITEAGKTWRYTSELLRDALFTGMACWLVWWPHTKFSLDRSPSFDELDEPVRVPA